MMKEGRKQLNEGPGAGYTLSGIINLNRVQAIRKVTVERETEPYSWNTHNIFLDCVITGTTEDLEAQSYFYGKGIGEVPVEITTVELAVHIPEDEDPNEFAKEHMDEIEEGLQGLAVKVEYVYGGGYVHSTFDGTISEIDHAVSDSDSYDGDVSFELWALDAKITDESVIDYIDKAVTGDTSIEVYAVIDEDGEPVDEFSEEADAIKFAKENGYPEVRRDIYELLINGDEDFADSETVWEADMEEAIKKHGKAIFEAAGKKKISLYVNGEYVCSSHQYTTARDFVDAVKREGKISYYGLKGTGIGMVTKTIQDTDKVTARLDESYLTESLGRYADTDIQEASLDVIERLASELGIKLRFGTKVGKYPQSVVLDYHYQDGAVYIGRNGHIDIQGKEFGSYQDDEFYADECEDELMDALRALRNGDEE